LGPSNWVAGTIGRRGSGQRRRTGGAPSRGKGQGGSHAHPGSVGSRDWGGEVAGAGARRWLAAAAAAGGAVGERAHAQDKVLHG
jgi:hypothetical protein